LIVVLQQVRGLQTQGSSESLRSLGELILFDAIECSRVVGQNGGHSLYESPSMPLVFEVDSTAGTEVLNEAFDKRSTVAAGIGDLDLGIRGVMGWW